VGNPSRNRKRLAKGNMTCLLPYNHVSATYRQRLKVGSSTVLDKWVVRDDSVAQRGACNEGTRGRNVIDPRTRTKNDTGGARTGRGAGGDLLDLQE
jgi:hypothetical protein